MGIIAGAAQQQEVNRVSTPVNVTPAVLSGKGYAGQTLTATPGDWGVDTPTGQHYANGSPISGATSLTYVVTQAHEGAAFTYVETVGAVTQASNQIHHFIPSDVAGLVFYDFSNVSTITHAANSVSSVVPSTGTGQTLTQATGSLQPVTGTASLNGRNGLAFASDVLSAASGGSVSRTLILLLKPSVAYTNASSSVTPLSSRDYTYNGLFFGSATSRLTGEIITVASGQFLANQYDDKQGVSGTAYPTITATPQIFSFVLSTNWFMGVDGTGDLRDLTSGTAYPIATEGAWHLGATEIQTKFCDGDYYCLAMSSTALSASDRQKVEGYIGHKFGVTLNGSNPYVSAPPGAP